MALNIIGFYRQNGGYDNLSNSLFVNLLPTSVEPPKSGGRYGPVRQGPKQFLSEDASAEPIVDLSSTYSAFASGGGVGCNVGRYASPYRGWGWQTCPQQGTNGWVKFDFALWWAEQSGAPRFVGGDDFLLAIGAGGTPSDYLCGYGRGDDMEVPVNRCPQYEYDGALVTPEPAPLALLATGLGALGVARRRRRGFPPARAVAGATIAA